MKSCFWDYDEDSPGVYETTCKNMFEFTADGVKENQFLYCPYCGGSIEVEPQGGET
jgi:hypothetical protein